MTMMLLVFACLLALGASHEHSFDDLGEQIAHFAGDVLDFDELIHGRVKHADKMMATMRWLESRVDDIEGSGCNDATEFQCGGEHPKCISRLLICDKVNDCENGADESQCGIYTPVGSKWRAKVYDDTCTKRRPDEVIFTFEDYKVPEELLSFPEVSATAHIDVENDDFSYSSTLLLHGYMDLKPGTHRLFFQPPESDGLAIECVFNGVHDGHCHGHILYVSSRTPCATIVMKRMD